MITKSVTITAQNQFTDPLAPYSNEQSQRCGHLSIAIFGTWEATIVLQRSFDSGSSWMTVASYTSNQQLSLNDKTEGVLYRLGCLTGGFTSGTCYGVIAK